MIYRYYLYFLSIISIRIDTEHYSRKWALIKILLLYNEVILDIFDLEFNGIENSFLYIVFKFNNNRPIEIFHSQRVNSLIDI